MPVRNERSVVHPPWLKIRWGWMATVALFLLWLAPVAPSMFGGSLFPIQFALLIAWLLWRAERDAGRN